MKRKNILGWGIIFLALVFASCPKLQAQSLKAQLTDLTAQLQKSPEDQELRKKIIKLSLKMSVKPPVPDEVNKFLGQAKYIMKQAKAPADYKDAVDAFQKASLLAPWSGDIYYNLGVVQEKAEDQAGALNSYNLYLLAKPHAKDKAAVEEKIGALEYVAGNPLINLKKSLDGGIWRCDKVMGLTTDEVTMAESTNSGTGRAYIVVEGDVIKEVSLVQLSSGNMMDEAAAERPVPYDSTTATRSDVWKSKVTGRQFEMDSHSGSGANEANNVTKVSISENGQQITVDSTTLYPNQNNFRLNWQSFFTRIK